MKKGAILIDSDEEEASDSIRSIQGNSIINISDENENSEIKDIQKSKEGDDFLEFFGIPQAQVKSISCGVGSYVDKSSSAKLDHFSCDVDRCSDESLRCEMDDPSLVCIDDYQPEQQVSNDNATVAIAEADASKHQASFTAGSVLDGLNRYPSSPLFVPVTDEEYSSHHASPADVFQNTRDQTLIPKSDKKWNEEYNSHIDPGTLSSREISSSIDIISEPANIPIPVALSCTTEGIGSSMLNTGTFKNQNLDWKKKTPHDTNITVGDVTKNKNTRLFDKQSNTDTPNLSELSSSMDEIKMPKNPLTSSGAGKQQISSYATVTKSKTNFTSFVPELSHGNNKDAHKTKMHSKSWQNILRSDHKTTDSSDISNSSVEIRLKNTVPKSVLYDTDKYTDEQLELMLERARAIEPQRLKKVNMFSVSKEDLTKRMTCCFSTCLDEKLKLLNQQYQDHIGLANFKVFDDQLLPIIKFERCVEATYFSKRSLFIPIKPRMEFEKFTILVYTSEELIDFLQNGIIKRHIQLLKTKYPELKFAVWIIGYDQLLQSLKTKINRLYKEKVQQKLNNAETASSRKRKKTVETFEGSVHPSDIKSKILRYEVEHDFSFQTFKGLRDLFDWLICFAYTLSLKHVDNLERNIDFSNIGKIKSADNPKACMIQMLTQIKGVNEIRAKKFVDGKTYSSIGELFEDAVRGRNLTEDKIMRSDHDKLMHKIFLSRDENELL